MSAIEYSSFFHCRSAKKPVLLVSQSFGFTEFYVEYSFNSNLNECDILEFYCSREHKGSDPSEIQSELEFNLNSHHLYPNSFFFPPDIVVQILNQMKLNSRPT